MYLPLWNGAILSGRNYLPRRFFEAPRRFRQYIIANMRAAVVLGHLLCLWAFRTARAKAYDPRRPADVRRKAMDTWVWNAMELTTALLDEREDADFFPGQDWDAPCQPKARNGTFL